MDQHKLRTLVFEKTGVRIDVDDPVFALVALNEAVLAEAVERHVALLDEATASLAEQAEALIGGGHAERPARTHAALPALLKPTPPAAVAPQARIAAIAGGAAVLCALLVLIGQALLFKPAPVPASTVIAKELTPEQAQAIRNGEKMAAIVQKLDAKTRNAIQAEMQKP
jgi:cytochrome c-type biogenesis protein CcmH/NrfG